MKRLITIAVPDDQEAIDSVANWLESIPCWRPTPDTEQQVLRAIVTGLRGVKVEREYSPAQMEIKVTLADEVTGLLARMEKAVDTLLHPPFEHGRTTMEGLAKHVFPQPRCTHKCTAGEVTMDTDKCGAIAEYMFYNRLRPEIPQYACVCHVGHVFTALLRKGDVGGIDVSQIGEGTNE